MVYYDMKKYKIYEYVYDLSKEASGVILPASMKYIEDPSGTVIYYNLNNGHWERGSGIKLLKKDKHLKLIREVTKKQMEQEIFVDGV